MKEKDLKPFKPIGPRKPDLLEFLIRFVFGFGLGALIGLYLYFRTQMYYGPYATIFTPAVLCGLLAGWKGDDFWYSIFGK